jgi:pimeloyl-ACP methyl ester carboxylesterase
MFKTTFYCPKELSLRSFRPKLNLASTGWLSASLPFVIFALIFLMMTDAGSRESSPAGKTKAVIQPERGAFFVGGITSESKEALRPYRGQMYVEYWAPKVKTRRPAIVFVHGANQSGVNFVSTPSGAGGWAAYFTSKGYPVYVVDQVGHGRSGPSIDLGEIKGISAVRLQQMFTHTERFNLWPQASSHKQWPTEEAALDQFLASQLPSYSDNVAIDQANVSALIALLEKIGPSVLLTHSRSSTFGWLAADGRSKLVLAIVAIEPHGPPYMDRQDAEPVRPYGVTYAPFSDQSLENVVARRDLIEEAVGSEPNTRKCWREKGFPSPPTLTTLAHIPVLVVTGEASYHAIYDHCTVDFLQRRNVKVDFVNLGKRGIHGNGHMLMLENNNEQIADVIRKWVGANVRR